MNIKKIARMGLLSGIALIIFIIELRLPDLTPIAGIKLGLSNIITVYALYHFSSAETAMILGVRILLGSFFTGNMIALLYSIGGGIMCLAIMIPLHKIIDEKNIWLCSVFGAVSHNIGQIIVAIAVMGTFTVITYLPFMIVAGCIAGVFTGIIAQILVKRIDFNKF